MQHFAIFDAVNLQSDTDPFKGILKKGFDVESMIKRQKAFFDDLTTS